MHYGDWRSLGQMEGELSHRCNLESGGGQDALGTPVPSPGQWGLQTQRPRPWVLPFLLRALALLGSHCLYHTTSTI